MHTPPENDLYLQGLLDEQLDSEAIEYLCQEYDLRPHQAKLICIDAKRNNTVKFNKPVLESLLNYNHKTQDANRRSSFPSKHEFLIYVGKLLLSDELKKDSQNKYEAEEEKIIACRKELDKKAEEIKNIENRLDNIRLSIHSENINLEELNTYRMYKILIMVGFTVLIAMLFQNLIATIIIGLIFFFVCIF